MLRRAMMAAGEAPPASNYWNPADKGVPIVLSDLDRVAAVSINSWASVRSVTSRSSGKFYAEMVYVSGTDSRVIMGVGTAAMALNNYVGAGTTSWGLQAGGGSGSTARLLNNGLSLGAVSSMPQGDYARVAIDFDTGNSWVGSSSAWVGGGSPSSGTSPSFTFTPGTTLFLACGLNGAGSTASCRARTGAAEFAGSVPSGFSAWG